MISYSLKEREELEELAEREELENEIISLRHKNKELEEDLNFYKSIFKTHSGSVLFNLRIKFRNGKQIWIDKIRCDRDYLLELDKDDEIEEWLKPVKCER
jgi:cell shape-determining protein MreC